MNADGRLDVEIRYEAMVESFGKIQAAADHIADMVGGDALIELQEAAFAEFQRAAHGQSDVAVTLAALAKTYGFASMIQRIADRKIAQGATP